MKYVPIHSAKARFDEILADIEATGAAITITRLGRPVAVLSPVRPAGRKFGQLPWMTVPDSFDDPLPEHELATWQGNSS